MSSLIKLLLAGENYSNDISGGSWFSVLWFCVDAELACWVMWCIVEWTGDQSSHLTTVIYQRANTARYQCKNYSQCHTGATFFSLSVQSCPGGLFLQLVMFCALDIYEILKWLFFNHFCINWFQEIFWLQKPSDLHWNPRAVCLLLEICKAG